MLYLLTDEKATDDKASETVIRGGCGELSQWQSYQIFFLNIQLSSASQIARTPPSLNIKCHPS